MLLSARAGRETKKAENTNKALDKLYLFIDRSGRLQCYTFEPAALNNT
jgi:hypothetical protein